MCTIRFDPSGFQRSGAYSAAFIAGLELRRLRATECNDGSFREVSVIQKRLLSGLLIVSLGSLLAAAPAAVLASLHALTPADR